MPAHGVEVQVSDEVGGEELRDDQHGLAPQEDVGGGGPLGAGGPGLH